MENPTFSSCPFQPCTTLVKWGSYQKGLHMQVKPLNIYIYTYIFNIEFRIIRLLKKYCLLVRSKLNFYWTTCILVDLFVAQRSMFVGSISLMILWMLGDFGIAPLLPSNQHCSDVALRSLRSKYVCGLHLHIQGCPHPTHKRGKLGKYGVQATNFPPLGAISFL